VQDIASQNPELAARGKLTGNITKVFNSGGQQQRASESVVPASARRLSGR
jgi:hypothetical protein